MKVFVGQWMVNIPVLGCQKVAQERPVASIQKVHLGKQTWKGLNWGKQLWIGPGGLRISSWEH